MKRPRRLLAVVGLTVAALLPSAAHARSLPPRPTESWSVLVLDRPVPGSERTTRPAELLAALGLHARHLRVMRGSLWTRSTIDGFHFTPARGTPPSLSQAAARERSGEPGSYAYFPVTATRLDGRTVYFFRRQDSEGVDALAVEGEVDAASWLLVALALANYTVDTSPEPVEPVPLPRIPEEAGDHSAPGTTRQGPPGSRGAVGLLGLD